MRVAILLGSLLISGAINPEFYERLQFSSFILLSFLSIMDLLELRKNLGY